MLNTLPSHAGERGLIDVKTLILTFLPLTAISPDAQTVQEKYLAPIYSRIDSGDCPPGLRKQYKLQLDQIKAQTPSHEIALFPSIVMSLGELESQIPTQLHSLLPTAPDPKKKYASFMSFLNQPFSRGSIVRIRDLPLLIVSEFSTLFTAHQVE